MRVLAFQHPFKFEGFVGLTEQVKTKNRYRTKYHYIMLQQEFIFLACLQNIFDSESEGRSNSEQKGYDPTNRWIFQQDHPVLYHAPKHYQLCGSTLQTLPKEYQNLLCLVNLRIDLCNLIALRRVLAITSQQKSHLVVLESLRQRVHGELVVFLSILPPSTAI